MPPIDAPAPVEDLDLHDHACWVSDAPAERRPRLTRFLSIGLARGERVGFYGASPEHCATAAADLAGAGVAVGELTARGQLIFGSAEAEYVGAAAFDPQRRLAGDAAAVQASLDSGYGGLRVAADVGWLQRHPAARTAWPGYELGADLLAAELPFTALCMYERQAWQPRRLALLEALHSHHAHDAARAVTAGFRVHGLRDGAIRLSGELDLIYAADVEQALAVAAQRCRAGVLDVTDLGFADVAGMRAIARACQTLLRHAGRATVRGASPTFRRYWRLAGFDRVEPLIEVA